MVDLIKGIKNNQQQKPSLSQVNTESKKLNLKTRVNPLAAQET